MKDSVAEFIRELEVFGTEAEGATRFFYTWRAIHAVLSDNERILEVLNENAPFWHTVLHGLLTASLVTLGRVFDQDKKSKHNIDRLLRTAQTNLGLFSKEALAERKRQLSPGADSWLAGYLKRVYVPTDNDFRRLRRYVAIRRRIYEEKYRPLRNEVFAHRGVSGQTEIDALFAKTKNRELQQLIVFLNRLYDALWGLLYNGQKPNLRPAKYAIAQMRRQRPLLYSGHTIQEKAVHDAERFLKSLIRDAQQSLSKGPVHTKDSRATVT